MTKQELIQKVILNNDFQKVSKTDFLRFDCLTGYWEEPERYAYDAHFFVDGILSFWKKTGRVTFKAYKLKSAK